MEARPEAICVWAQTIRAKGTALFNSPNRKYSSQARASRGKAMPMNAMAINSTIDARPTRMATMVSGGNSKTAMPTNRNDPPHNSDNSPSKPYSRAVILRLIGGVAAMLDSHRGW